MISIYFLKGDEKSEDVEIVPDEKLMELADNFLKLMDKNNDGYVTYPEYRMYSVPNN